MAIRWAPAVRCASCRERLLNGRERHDALLEPESLFLSVPSFEVVPFGRGRCCLEPEGFVMKPKELKAALRLITVVSNDPRLEPGQRDQLLRARRQLESAARSGRPNKKKIFTAVGTIATVLQSVVGTK